MSNVVCFLSKDNLLSKSDLIQYNKQINYSFLYYHEAYKTILFLIQGKRITKENNLLTIWNMIPTDRFVNVTSVWIDFGIEIPSEVKRQGNYLVDKEGKKIISKQTFIQGKLTLFFTHHVDDKRYTETKKTISLITKQANDLLRLGYNPIEKIEMNVSKTKKTRKQFWSLVVKYGHETGIKYDEVASIAYEKILNTSYDDFMNFGKVRNGKEKVIDVVDRLVDGDFTDLYNVLVNEFKF